jgi:shikimate dehydrogenase
MLRSGLIGKDILASRSPWLHEEEARALGMQLTYELFDFAALELPDGELGPLLLRLRVQGFCGVNVTHPFKQQEMAHLDEIEPAALLVGAVNTVAMRSGRLVGHNTDMPGFRDSFARSLPAASLTRIVQLGAGGAGAAVACALLSLGARRLEIIDIRAERARELAARLRERFPRAEIVGVALEMLELAHCSGLVNTTPIGMTAHPGTPVDPRRLDPSMWVVDIVYFPLETKLLQQARELGCRTLNGSGMVVAQAALAFEILTGRVADPVRMAGSFGQTGAQAADATLSAND